ncbi:serine-rich adhesin for platelets-like [Argopecten irradians]|uniref:serine-rich adhesin for platelets-like n=1 Tax=Argopecten irradians TaxID=31199 RepID=UPI00371971EF
MNLSRFDRCSTCLRKCSAATGQNLMSCGHHTCFTCHQRQWLSSERNDSEEINCVNCTLTVLNKQSRDGHSLLKSHPELFRSTKADTADKLERSHTDKDGTSNVCLQYYKYRTHSSPANVFLPAKEPEIQNKLSNGSCNDIPQCKKELDWTRYSNDIVHKLNDPQSSEDVPRITPEDPKQTRNYSKTTLCLESSSLNPLETRDLKQPPGSHHSTHTHKTLVSTCGQCMDAESSSTAKYDNGSKRSEKSRHRHKSSHKKSKKKKKHKEDRRKSRNDNSLDAADTTGDKTMGAEKQTEKSSNPDSIKAPARVCKEEDRGDLSPINVNNKKDSLSIFTRKEKDQLSTNTIELEENVSGDSETEEEKLGIKVETEVKQQVKMTYNKMGEEDVFVVGRPNEMSTCKDGNQIVDNNEDHRLPTVRISEVDIFSIVENDDGLSAEDVLPRSPTTSLDAYNSSGRFSSPMSLDDFQLNNILESNDNPSLEVQDWGDSESDGTRLELENHNLTDSDAKDKECMTNKEIYNLPASLSNTLLAKEPKSLEECCTSLNLLQDSQKENDPPECHKTPMQQCGQGDISLDDSILDRSGVLYYNPIDDSDEDRLVIVSKPPSEVSVSAGDELTTKAKKSLSVMSTEGQLSSASNSKSDLVNNYRLGKTDNDHEQLSCQQNLSKTSNHESADECKDRDLPLHDTKLFRGFRESYATSLICSQMANKALITINESAKHQKGPYQLSAKMLTGVLKILVQQADLASAICSDLLDSTESEQTTELFSKMADTADVHRATSSKMTPGAKTCAAIDTSENVRDTSDACSNNCSVSKLNALNCKIFEKYSAEATCVSSCNLEETKSLNESERNSESESITGKPPQKEITIDREKHRNEIMLSTDVNDLSRGQSLIKEQTSTKTTISTSKDQSDKGNEFVNQNTLDTKCQVVKKESELQSYEITGSKHHGNRVNTKNVKPVGKGNHTSMCELKIKTEGITATKSEDEHGLQYERNINKCESDENGSLIATSQTFGKQNKLNEDTTNTPSVSNHIPSHEKKTPARSVEGTQRSSMITQLTKDGLETKGHEQLKKQNAKISDNQWHDAKNDKHDPNEKELVHSGDAESINKISTNKHKSSKEKRNLFNSVLETGENVVESPCKYRKLQFGKLPQSYVKENTSKDTPTANSDKSYQGKVMVTSLSDQNIKIATKSKILDSRGATNTKGINMLTASENESDNVSMVAPSTMLTTENKQKTSSAVHSSTKRSSSVPSSQQSSDRKDKSSSRRSRYHSNYGTSDKDPHQRSSSYHRSSNKKSQKRLDVTTDTKVKGRVSVDICVLSGTKGEKQTPNKCKESDQVKKGNTLDHNKTKRGLSFDVKKRSGNEDLGKSLQARQVNPTNLKDKNTTIDHPNRRSNDTTKSRKGKDDSQPTTNDTENTQQSKPLPSNKLQQQCAPSKTKSSDAENSSMEKHCNADHTHDLGITSNVIGKCNEDFFIPTLYHNIPSSTIQNDEEHVDLLNQKDETYSQRSLARDEEIFRCLSFSDSDNDDVPLADIIESLRANQHKVTSSVNGTVNSDDEDDEDLPKLAVPNTSKFWKQQGHRRSRCDRPGLKTYLEIRNSIQDGCSDKEQCSDTPVTTWRNSLMPPPLEAVRRSKSRETVLQSTPSKSQKAVREVVLPTSRDVSRSQSSDSDQGSDLVHCDDGEGHGDRLEREGGKRKKKRHRRKKSEKPVVSSSSEEHIPKGRKRGFQWKQECLRILDRVYNHEFSDPFRHEIKSKDIPDYYKIVKRGMCFDIIGYKLRCNIYEELRDFFLDVRLVFDNCRLYHKTDSPIYQAGLVVKCFFRKVAKEILMPRHTTAKSMHSN